MIIAETFTLNPSLVHRTVSLQCVSGNINIPPLTGARERLPYLDKDLDGRVKFTVYLLISSSPLANLTPADRLAREHPVASRDRVARPRSAHETINSHLS